MIYLSNRFHCGMFTEQKNTINLSEVSIEQIKDHINKTRGNLGIRCARNDFDPSSLAVLINTMLGVDIPGTISMIKLKPGDYLYFGDVFGEETPPGWLSDVPPGFSVKWYKVKVL